ncbi:MAG: oligosaccharide flippase family protein [Spirochaetia bacterium]|nr:oligosaccharide flippase family protein [Spirochaetia bacterium]MCF7940751.1 oligosaccharide flippase family protein [Spirochaetia bacterium]
MSMIEKNRSSAIIKNTLSNYGRQAVQILVFLVLTPFIAARLGTEAFGLWALLQAVIGLFGLLDLGFGTSVVKYIAEARSSDDPSRLSYLTATFFWVYMVLAAIVIAAASAFVIVLPAVLSIPDTYAGAAQMVFMLVAFRTALGMPLGMFMGVMTGFQRQWWANSFKIAGTLLYAGGTFWALLAEPSVERLGAVNLIANTVAMALGAWVCVTRLPGVSVNPRFFRLHLVREISSFSLFIFIIQVSTLIYTRVDSLIVQSVLSLSAVALYSVASRIAEEASGMCRQLTNALTPVVAELHGSGDTQNIRAVLLLGTKLSTALAVPLLLGLAFLVEPLLAAWMGEDFRQAAAASQILLAAMLISVIHGNAANVLSMTGHQKYLAGAFFGGQMLNLTLTLLLIRWFGLMGVALATLISSALVDMGLVQPRANRSTGITFWRFYLSSVVPSVIPVLVMYLSLLGLVRIYPPDSLFAIAVIEAAACVVFFSVFILIGLKREERSYIYHKIRRPKRRAQEG